jgi:hypothetical protein
MCRKPTPKTPCIMRENKKDVKKNSTRHISKKKKKLFCLATEHDHVREKKQKGKKREREREAPAKERYEGRLLDTVAGSPDAGRGRGAPFAALVRGRGPLVLVGRLLAEIERLGRHGLGAVCVQQLVAVGRRRRARVRLRARQAQVARRLAQRLRTALQAVQRVLGRGERLVEKLVFLSRRLVLLDALRRLSTSSAARDGAAPGSTNQVVDRSGLLIGQRVVTLQLACGGQLVHGRNGRSRLGILDIAQGLVQRLVHLGLGDGAHLLVDEHGGPVAVPGAASDLRFHVVVGRGNGGLVAAGEAPGPLAEVREEALLVGAGRRRKAGLAVEGALGLGAVHLGVVAVVVVGVDRELAAQLLVLVLAVGVAVGPRRHGVGQRRNGLDGGQNGHGAGRGPRRRSRECRCGR